MLLVILRVTRETFVDEYICISSSNEVDTILSIPPLFLLPLELIFTPVGTDFS